MYKNGNCILIEVICGSFHCLFFYSFIYLFALIKSIRFFFQEKKNRYFLYEVFDFLFLIPSCMNGILLKTDGIFMS